MSDTGQQGGGLSRDAKAMMAFQSAKKSAGIAYLLWFFFGGFGIHRFYLGRTGSGIAMLILLVLSLILLAIGIGVFGLIAVGIWVIVDIFLIPGIARDYNQALMRRIDAGTKA